jgi:hypothetical protein
MVCSSSHLLPLSVDAANRRPFSFGVQRLSFPEKLGLPITDSPSALAAIDLAHLIRCGDHSCAIVPIIASPSDATALIATHISSALTFWPAAVS